MIAEAVGKLVLRLMLGGLMLFHGINKATHGIGFIKKTLIAHHIPEMVAYGVYVGEILAPIFIIIGWKSRIWAGVMVFHMGMAIYLTKLGVLLQLGSHGAWAVETPMFFLLSALVVTLIGSGRYAVMRD